LAARHRPTPPNSCPESLGELGTAWPQPALTWMWPMLVVAEPVGADVTAEQRYARLVAARHAAGTVSTLTMALANLALAEAALGRWPEAIGTATEGLQLATETGPARHRQLLSGDAGRVCRPPGPRQGLPAPSRPHASWRWSRRSRRGRSGCWT
jgi:hypothetical protein